MIATRTRPVRRLSLAFLTAAVLTLGATASVGAASNPSGTGQPNQSCGSATALSSPPGFNTSGFSHATTQYAGAGPSADHSNSGKAVSQYDVACYQVSSNGH